MKYLGHTKDGKCFTGEENSQELITHLKNVSNYAEKFAMSFDVDEMGWPRGMVVSGHHTELKDSGCGSNMGGLYDHNRGGSSLPGFKI